MAFDNSGKPSRGLPFPLKNPETFSFVETTGDVTHLTPDIFPADSDEKINIVLNLSLNEFVALASSIDVGSDIAYGDDRNLIWWTWVRSFIGLAANMSCADVADCVESELVTNQTLINQVTNTVNQSGFGNPNRVNSTVTKIEDRNPVGFNDEVIYEQSHCDLDALWSGIRYGIVARMDDTVRDVLEDLASIADIPERIEVFLDIVPVLGDIAEGVLFNISETAPDLLNLYNAYSSEATLDELACDIFGLVCSECRYPTHEELYNYYQSFGMPATPSIQDFVLEVMSELVQGAVGVIAKTAYFTLQTWHLGILYLQAKFAGNNGSKALYDMARLGEDFSSDNWLQLCDDCVEAYRYKTWDLKAEKTGTDVTWGYNIGGAGVWIAGQGWVAAAIDNTNGIITIGLNLDPTWKIRAIGIKGSAASGNANLTSHWRTTRASATGQVGIAWAWGTTGYTWYANGFASLTGYREVGIRYATALAQNNAIEAITIIFDADFAPSDAIPTAGNTLSGTVYPYA